MIGRIFISGLAGIAFCLLGLVSCRERERVWEPAELPTDLFQDGDLVFRRGMGFTSRVVLAADRDGAYSHVGILKRIDGKWCVIHAVPGEPDYQGDKDRVKVDAVETFFSRTRAANGAVMRVKKAPEQARRAAERALALARAGVLFDHDYDLTDTAQMYCTELIEFVYKKGGIDLSEGRLSKINIPLFNGDYLLPCDIAQSGKLCLIYKF